MTEETRPSVTATPRERARHWDVDEDHVLHLELLGRLSAIAGRVSDDGLLELILAAARRLDRERGPAS